ncbi:hypothetical protein F5884DRAFT_848845 [Xylogone sp. PMI_703]|nr:hypothetical protein F5884DRAFT_848845 [Xylogone sp. PMI_703]
MDFRKLICELFDGFLEQHKIKIKIVLQAGENEGFAGYQTPNTMDRTTAKTARVIKTVLKAAFCFTSKDIDELKLHNGVTDSRWELHAYLQYLRAINHLLMCDLCPETWIKRPKSIRRGGERREAHLFFDDFKCSTAEYHKIPETVLIDKYRSSKGQ